VEATKIVDLPNEDEDGKSLGFMALAFTPVGMFGSSEELIAGSTDGSLYHVPRQASSTPRLLGGFPMWKQGDPSPGTGVSGDTTYRWQLSGDAVFYPEGATFRGLAVLRACKLTNSSYDCRNADNDVLVEVDVAALVGAYSNRTSAANLRKRWLGNGTGYGQLFGIGAWNKSVWAFASAHYDTRADKMIPAYLLEIDSTGRAQVQATWSDSAFIETQSNGNQRGRGWYGAGVTTVAPISVLQ
jgi:hypothetical protein